MKINKDVFRTYDIRGLTSDIRPDFAYNLGRALAHFWSLSPQAAGLEHKVAVGYDARESSPQLAHALMEGFALCKWSAVSLGLVPTPVVYYSSVQTESPFGVVVTASHNPAEYNGFKLCVRGQASTTQEMQELYHWMTSHSVSYKHSNASFPLASTAQEYLRFLNQQILASEPTRSRKLKIVVDCGNGSAGPIAVSLYRATGHDIIPLFEKPDGRFPNHHPDPSDEMNLKDLRDAIAKNGADFGLALDGDGDRLGLLLRDGKIVYGDQLLLLFASEVLPRHPGATIITEVKASQAVLDELERLGGKPLVWKTGHSLIKAKMKETRCPVAGEMSGHFFFSDNYLGFDDALYAGLRVILWAQRRENQLSSFFEKLPKLCSTPEIRIDCADSVKFVVVKKIVDHFSREFDVNTIDGARISFSDGAWGLVRASNTQPALVLRFEARDAATLRSIRENVETHLNEVMRICR